MISSRAFNGYFATGVGARKKLAAFTKWLDRVSPRGISCSANSLKNQIGSTLTVWCRLMAYMIDVA
jgi:hypothetical protein